MRKAHIRGVENEVENLWNKNQYFKYNFCVLFQQKKIEKEEEKEIREIKLYEMNT